MGTDTIGGLAVAMTWMPGPNNVMLAVAQPRMAGAPG
jgi:hypothetical protein